MPEFEITLSRIFSITVTREFESEAAAEEFASNHSWTIEDADVEEGESIIVKVEE